ncbi:MAG: hypothetical protein JST04_08695 [Bdellovibrionales bacterium]|nr:hypothetical protein [Bdellovibrionales bacterium]
MGLASKFDFPLFSFAIVGAFGVFFCGVASASTVSVFSNPGAATRTACSYAPVVLSVKNTSATAQSVKLAVTGSAKLFSDGQCSVSLASFRAKSGSSSKSVYLKDTVAESVSITATIQSAKAVASMKIYAATNVLDLGASGSDAKDDSSAFASAISAASTAVTDFPAGPRLDAAGTTKPQAIVYVPKGTYYLSKVYLASNVRLEIDANAVLRGGADPNVKCQNLLILDTKNSSNSLASAEPPITNVSIVGVGTATDVRDSIPEFDVSHSFTLDDDPTHQICGWKTNGDGSLADAGVIPPMIMVRNVTGFLFENLYSVQSYDAYPIINGVPKNFPANVVVFQSAVGGNYNVVKGAGGTTQYPKKQQTPVSQFTHPRYGIYRNHVNLNAPAGYGPAQIQSGENLTFEGMYSRGGVAMRFETDVAGNALDPDNDPNSPCKNYNGSGPDYRCYAWGAKLDVIKATRIRCVNGNAGLYLAAHGQVNGTVSIDDLRTDHCYTGISESANSSEWNSTGDSHLLTGQFLPTIGSVTIVGSDVNKSGACLFDGCLAQRPCSSANTWIANVMSSDKVAISSSAAWGVMPSDLTVTGGFGSSGASCPKN